MSDIPESYIPVPKVEPITVKQDGEDVVQHPITFKLKRPDGPDGKERDQTNDAAEHIKYAHTLDLPRLTPRDRPRLGRALIVGGGPSVKGQLENIRELSKDPNNAILTVNWTHTWLLNNGIVPYGSVFFEIDAEPDTVLEKAHPEVHYFICSHCHQRTFDMLKGYRRVLWDSPPNSDPEKVVHEELKIDPLKVIGGGVSTFTRALGVALHLGFRHIDLFGIDSSFPDNGLTHVEGYETVMDGKTDGIPVSAKCMETGEVRQFRTLGYLALQVEEFKIYCQANHHHYSLRVHGDSLMSFVHRQSYKDQYNY